MASESIVAGSDLDPSFVPLQGPPISHLEKKNTPNRKNLIVRDPVVYSPPPKGALVPVIPKPTRWLGTRPNAIIDAEGNGSLVHRYS